MNETQGLAEISEALGVAWKVYEYGWIREHTPNPQLARFGEEIQKLADGLSNIARVVENARICYQQQTIRSPIFRGFSVQRDWNLSSLHEICGSFKTTILECEALLAHNRDVSRSDSSAYGDEWMMVMKPKVDEMCVRLRMHNIKLNLVLKPLETKLLGDIYGEFMNQSWPQNSRQAVPVVPIQGIVVDNIEQTLAEYSRPPSLRLDVSSDIDSQVRLLLEEVKPELRVPGSLRLQVGSDIFMEYYDGSTKAFVPGNLVSERQPSAQQYINLIKSYHVLQSMYQSRELRQVDRVSVWPLFVAELTSAIHSECQKFSSRGPDRLLPPDLNSLKRALRGPRDGLGSREDVSKLMSPHFETYSKPIFNISLPSPQNGVQRTLSISRVDLTKLRLVEAVHERTSPELPIGEIVMDIDLNTVQLAPIYATPSSRPRPFEVLLHTQLGQLNPTFCEIKHIYRLQHLLTGYKVYDKYDQAMVKISFFISGQSTPLEEHGRVQLWLPQPFNTGDKPLATPSKTSVDGGASMIQEPATLIQPRGSSSSVARTSSFRRLFSRSRRGSDAHESLNPSTLTPSARLAASSSALGPTTFGPFELSAVDQSPTRAFNGASSLIRGHAHSDAASGVNMSHAILPHMNVYRPQGSSHTPRSSQHSLPTQTPHHTADHRNAQRDHTPTNLSQPGWPYSPDSFSPASPPPWVTERSTDGAVEHRQTPSICTSTMSTNHLRTTSTFRPAAANAQSSPSVVSTRSTRSHSSMASTVSTIRTSTGNSSVSSSGLARMHHKPQKPLLVMFLKSRDPLAKLSIVAIQIDGNTSVVRERCECYNSHSTCRTSCVERSSGSGLLAQRWEADVGLTSFNVARLGEFQRKDNQDLWPNLKRVSLRFEKMEDRYRFAGSPCACTVQTTHELSRCNLQSHNGVFGIVKQIGDQMLMNYHNERNSALTKPMVLAPLAESDLIA